MLSPSSFPKRLSSICDLLAEKLLSSFQVSPSLQNQFCSFLLVGFFRAVCPTLQYRSSSQLNVVLAEEERR